jgi:hypothetical protein
VKKIPLLFLLLLLGAPSISFAICAQIRHTLTASVANGRGSYILGEGELYPAVGKNKDGTKLSLLMGTEKVIVNRQDVILRKGPICAQKKILPEQRPQPEEKLPEEAPKDPDHLEVFDNSPKKAASREAVPPTAPAEEEPASTSDGKSHWGVEAGDSLLMSSDDYSGLVTKVPDPTNVGSLQDPIITEVKKAHGFYVRLFHERDATPLLRVQLALGYQQKTYAYVFKQNPTTGAVRLEDLPSSEKDFQAHQLEMGVGASFKHISGRWILAAGARLNLIYNLSGKYKVDVMLPSGPIFKNTPSTVEGGPDSFGYSLKGVLDAQYRRLRLSFAVDQDAGVSAGVGLLF